MSKAREFLDFWTTNSIHAAEQYGSAGAQQNVSELVNRCEAMGQQQGISRADMEAEVGDLTAYIRSALKDANAVENSRRNRHQPN